MKIETTGRGFVIAHFKDGNGEACSLQKSSAAERDMIWLGVDDPNPQFFPGDGTGWHPYPLPENVQCSTRMHLTRERVAELLPLLQGFVEAGELVESPPKSGTNDAQDAARYRKLKSILSAADFGYWPDEPGIALIFRLPSGSVVSGNLDRTVDALASQPHKPNCSISDDVHETRTDAEGELPGPELGPNDKLPCAVACEGGPSFGEGVTVSALLGYLARRVTYNNSSRPEPAWRSCTHTDGFKCRRFRCLVQKKCLAAQTEAHSEDCSNER